jgi:hypothetical protein
MSRITARTTKAAAAPGLNTRSVSRQGPATEDPGTPVSLTRQGSAPPEEPVAYIQNKSIPLTTTGARRLLLSQKFIEKANDPIALGTIRDILSDLVHRTSTNPTTSCIIHSLVNPQELVRARFATYALLSSRAPCL